MKDTKTNKVYRVVFTDNTAPRVITADSISTMYRGEFITFTPRHHEHLH